MIPVEATVVISVTLKNESGEPRSNVLLSAKLNRVTFAGEDGWKADGGNAMLMIESIGPNEEISRRLTVRVVMAPMPPTGGEAEVTVEAKAAEAP